MRVYDRPWPGAAAADATWPWRGAPGQLLRMSRV